MTEWCEGKHYTLLHEELESGRGGQVSPRDVADVADDAQRFMVLTRCHIACRCACNGSVCGESVCAA